MKRLKIGDEVVDFYSVKELADKIGKHKDSIIKLEQRGKIPTANFRTRAVFVNKKRGTDVAYLEAKALYNEYERQLEENGAITIEISKALEGLIKDRQCLKGTRLYSDFLVTLLIPLYKKITRGTEINQELLNNINEAFLRERDKYK